MVVDSYAVLRGVRLLFLVRMRRFIPIPVVVGLRVHVEVAGVVLYALVRMRVGVPEPVLVVVGHRGWWGQRSLSLRALPRHRRDFTGGTLRAVV